MVTHIAHLYTPNSRHILGQQVNMSMTRLAACMRSLCSVVCCCYKGMRAFAGSSLDIFFLLGIHKSGQELELSIDGYMCFQVQYTADMHPACVRFLHGQMSCVSKLLLPVDGIVLGLAERAGVFRLAQYGPINSLSIRKNEVLLSVQF